jgi:6-phosphofructokinase 2
MPDILTLTMNPAVDLSTTTAAVRPTHKLRCSDPVRHPGGGGINVARVVHRLGGDCRAVYLAGGPTGAQLHDLLADEGVVGTALPIAAETRENVAVVDESNGAEYRFVLPGPQVQAAEWQACLAYFEALPAMPRYVVASGSLPPGVPDDFYARLAQSVNPKGGRLVLDTSGAALVATLAHGGIHLAKPSLRELEDWAGHALPQPQAWTDAARSMVATGKVHMLALSLGAEGALLATQAGVWSAPALPVQVAGTTGAGDSLLAAMVWSLARGDSAPEALAWGVAAGAAALLTGGTALCEADIVQRFYKDVQVTQG